MGDVNGDGKADYCRIIGAGQPDRYVACALASDEGFGNVEFRSAPGVTLADTAAQYYLADVNEDGRADFCTVSSRGRMVCTLATTFGFGPYQVSGSVGYNSSAYMLEGN